MLTTRGGDDLPVLVMSHQSPLHAGHYERVLPLLGAFCRPIAFDTPGYGLSDPVPDGWEITDYADLLWEIADHAGGDRAIVFGRATGSIIALEAAHRRPDRTLGLILHGLPVYSATERRERLASDFAEPIPPRSDGSHLIALWERVLGQYPYLTPDEVQWHVDAYLLCGPDYATAYRAMWRYDPEPAMRSLAVPVHLLGGDRDRVGHWFEPARARIPAATSHFFEAATDFIAHDDPERFAGEIHRFVRSVTQH
ncbi:MAG TPA: alpha/beta hydrolase [Acidimicrobiia bacterium]|nr:alpha/beta hydrolase [Acidimicrobiia bacterium]